MNFKTFLPLQRLLSHLCCLQLYKRNKSVCRQNVTLSIRGGSRVVQVICTNHSNFFPNLISQLFIAVDEINYPPCFIVYYEINKTTERLFRRSHSKPSPSRAKWTSHRSRGFVLVDLSRTTRKKICRHDRTKFLPRG